jgi:hypothetical protein
MARYVIRIAPEALQAVARTAFDPPDNLVFLSRERAEGFCESLNRCLGYERFIVVEAGEKPGLKRGQVGENTLPDGGEYDAMHMLLQGQRRAGTVAAVR